MDAANKEGEVTVYGAVNQKSIDLLVPGFQKEYPNIKLTYVRLSASDLLARLDAEIASGNAGADAVDNLDHATFDGYASKGNLLPITVPSVGDAAYNAKQNMRTPYVATIGTGPYAWAWNTKLLPNGINSWQDYLALGAGKLGVTDPSIGPAVASLAMTMEQPDAGGAGFLDKIAKLQPRIYPGSSAEVTAMAAGEVVAALPVPMSVAATSKASGAPIDYKAAPVAQSIPTEVAIIKSGKHPNAAQVYANWVLSNAGQAVMTQGGFVVVRSGVTQTVDISGATKIVELPQITTDQFKAFVVRWNQLLAR